MEAIFEFLAENPPTALIVGGILMLLLSAITITLDPSTTKFLRDTGWALISLGVILNILWLFSRR